jgi:hypothetical protein
MTVIEFLGCPSEVTRPIQLDKGSTPSRATANTSLDDATIQTLVFCVDLKNQQSLHFITRKLERTMVRPMTAMMVMTMLPPFPKAKAYI